jgi:hypothetical protein
MESTITGTIEDVTGRQVNTKYGAKTIWDVVIGGQKVNTFKNEIAEEANALKGSTVEAQIREEPSKNPDYPPNHILLSVELVNAIGAQPAAASTIPVTTERKGWQPEDTARVTKLSCLSTAFQYSAAMGDSVDDAITLARRLYDIAMDSKAGADEPEPVAVATETTDDVPW